MSITLNKSLRLKDQQLKTQTFKEGFELLLGDIVWEVANKQLVAVWVADPSPVTALLTAHRHSVTVTTTVRAISVTPMQHAMINLIWNGTSKRHLVNIITFIRYI